MKKPRKSADPKSFTIGLIQMSCDEDPRRNLKEALDRIREAARRGAQIICLQELFRSQYFCQRQEAGFFDLAEPIPGPSTQAIAKLARGLEVAVIAPVFERRAPGIYHNSAAVIDAGGSLLGIYRKNHIPDDPRYFEKYYFTPGDLGYRVFQTRFAKVGILICWDQWYPEAARLTALQGAEIIFYPTAIGWLPEEQAREGKTQHDAWRTMQRAHAIANGVFVAAANRVGFEGPRGAGLNFWGASFVSSPRGELIAEASHDKEEILLARCERDRIESFRRSWPFLRDRRIDTYGPIASRYLDGPGGVPAASGNGPDR